MHAVETPDDPKKMKKRLEKLKNKNKAKKT